MSGAGAGATRARVQGHGRRAGPATVDPWTRVRQRPALVWRMPPPRWHGRQASARLTTTYVALLRGINVGGRTLRMEALRPVIAGMGLQDVRTYIQSGNVLFRSDGAVEAAELERAIADAFGMPVGVLLRTADEMAAVSRANPFVGRDGNPRHLHVTFLANEPAGDLAGVSHPPEEHHLAGREIYLLCPNGYGESKLGNAFFERRLKVAATTRNWATVMRLTEMAAGMAAGMA